MAGWVSGDLSKSNCEVIITSIKYLHFSSTWGDKYLRFYVFRGDRSKLIHSNSNSNWNFKCNLAMSITDFKFFFLLIRPMKYCFQRKMTNIFQCHATIPVIPKYVRDCFQTSTWILGNSSQFINFYFSWKHEICLYFQ